MSPSFIIVGILFNLILSFLIFIKILLKLPKKTYNQIDDLFTKNIVYFYVSLAIPFSHIIVLFVLVDIFRRVSQNGTTLDYEIRKTFNLE